MTSGHFPHSTRNTRFSQSMVIVVTAWSDEDGELHVRISTTGTGDDRQSTWAHTPEEAGEAIRRALEALR